MACQVGGSYGQRLTDNGLRWGMSPVSDTSVQGALRKVDLLSAFCAAVGLAEFIGKDLFAFTAFGTFTDK